VHIRATDKDFTWQPTSSRGNKDVTSEVGFSSEAFFGSEDVFDRYLQTVAEHVGGCVIESAQAK